MALFKCPECNKIISDKADCCIGCGLPQNLFFPKTQIQDADRNTDVTGFADKVNDINAIDDECEENCGDFDGDDDEEESDEGYDGPESEDCYDAYEEYCDDYEEYYDDYEEYDYSIDYDEDDDDIKYDYSSKYEAQSGYHYVDEDEDNGQKSYTSEDEDLF